MTQNISRRVFLGSAAAAGALSIIPHELVGKPSPAVKRVRLPFPAVDFHAHFDKDFAVEQAVELAKQRGVKLGIVEHGGLGELIGNDGDLKKYIETLAPYPVYKGMQAEGLKWMKCFSKEVVAQLDYVLSDALTMPDKDGRLVRIWYPEVKVEDKQDFMERYVDFNVRVISEEPIDIFANPTFLPDCIAKEYDALWTKERMKRIIDAALEHDVAIEINSRFNIPSRACVAMAKKAGVKFSFGSNSHREAMGKLDYSLKIGKEFRLTAKDMFAPKPADQKPILRR